MQHGIDCAVLVTEHGGLGHTSAIYANDDDVVDRYAVAVRTGRILVNAPTAVGALGGIYNNLTPTFSLGCGTWGGSSTTENVNYRQLLNIKTVSRRDPAAVVPGAVEHVLQRGRPGQPARPRLRAGRRGHRPLTEERGVVDQVRTRLRTRHVTGVHRGEPEPDEATDPARRRVLREREPDLLIAVGGGSVLDAAKAMRLFYEHPEMNLDELTMPFLDPRKRVADFPTDRHGSSWSPSQRLPAPARRCRRRRCSPSDGRKETLVDYCLVPDIAIVDPLLTLMPPG